jgi:hypothetical protein
MPNRRDDQLLDVWSRCAGDAACILLAILQHGLRDIVAVAHALLVGAARAHQVAAIIEEKAAEEGRRARPPHLASDRPMLEFRRTASNSSLLTIGCCSPGWTSPR